MNNIYQMYSSEISQHIQNTFCVSVVILYTYVCFNCLRIYNSVSQMVRHSHQELSDLLTKLSQNIYFLYIGPYCCSECFYISWLI
jgi:hypothetical protein